MRGGWAVGLVMLLAGCAWPSATCEAQLFGQAADAEWDHPGLHEALVGGVDTSLAADGWQAERHVPEGGLPVRGHLPGLSPTAIVSLSSMSGPSQAWSLTSFGDQGTKLTVPFSSEPAAQVQPLLVGAPRDLVAECQAMAARGAMCALAVDETAYKLDLEAAFALLGDTERDGATWQGEDNARLSLDIDSFSLVAPGNGTMPGFIFDHEGAWRVEVDAFDHVRWFVPEDSTMDEDAARMFFEQVSGAKGGDVTCD